MYFIYGYDLSIFRILDLYNWFLSSLISMQNWIGKYDILLSLLDEIDNTRKIYLSH